MFEMVFMLQAVSYAPTGHTGSMIWPATSITDIRHNWVLEHIKNLKGRKALKVRGADISPDESAAWLRAFHALYQRIKRNNRWYRFSNTRDEEAYVEKLDKLLQEEQADIGGFSWKDLFVSYFPEFTRAELIESSLITMQTLLSDREFGHKAIKMALAMHVENALGTRKGLLVSDDGIPISDIESEKWLKNVHKILVEEKQQELLDWAEENLRIKDVNKPDDTSSFDPEKVIPFSWSFVVDLPHEEDSPFGDRVIVSTAWGKRSWDPKRAGRKYTETEMMYVYRNRGPEVEQLFHPERYRTIRQDIDKNQIDPNHLEPTPDQAEQQRRKQIEIKQIEESQKRADIATNNLIQRVPATWSTE